VKWSTGQIDNLTAVDHRRIAKDMKRNGDFAGAFTHLMIALNLGITPAETGKIHAEAGEAAFKLEDYETAITQFRLALALGVDTSFTNASLARALHQQQEAPEIIRSHFERALLLQDRNAWAHSWFSTFLKETGDLAAAELQARKAVELQPQNALFLHNLALMLMEYGGRAHLLEAQKHLQKAVTYAQPDFKWPQEYLLKVEELLNQADNQVAASDETYSRLFMILKICNLKFVIWNYD
jgi:tetratricopeptide (TPR) repeat protein